MEKQDNKRAQVTKDDIYIGMPVVYYKAPKSVGFDTQIISIPPQEDTDDPLVLCAMVGEKVRISTLRMDKDTGAQPEVYGDRFTCCKCGSKNNDNFTGEMYTVTKVDGTGVYYTCSNCVNEIVAELGRGITVYTDGGIYCNGGAKQ